MFNLNEELKNKVKGFLLEFDFKRQVAYAEGISLEASSDCSSGCQGSCYGCSGSCSGGCSDGCSTGYKNN